MLEAVSEEQLLAGGDSKSTVEALAKAEEAHRARRLEWLGRGRAFYLPARKVRTQAVPPSTTTTTMIPRSQDPACS